jgi:hypothetical protein
LTLPRTVAPDRLTEYRNLVAVLATAAARCEADLTAAERAYASAVATVEAELAEVTAAAERAERAAASAAAVVLAIDEETDRLWSALRKAMGWRGLLLGAPPAPDPDPPAQAPPAQVPPAQVPPARSAPDPAVGPPAGPPAGTPRGGPPRVVLDRAAARIAALRRSRPTAPPPRWATPLMPVLGAAVASAFALVAGGLVSLGRLPSEAADGLRIGGYLTLLIAPFSGIPVAVALMGRRFGSRLDTGAIALIILGGMVAGCAIPVALR